MKQAHSHIHQYFDHVYVLNLEHRPERKIAMMQKLGRLGIAAEFVKAIDGYSSQNQAEYQHYLEKPLGGTGSHPMEISQQRKLISSPGAWGYLKTYLGILTDAKKRGFERILCFDDDVLFHKDFEEEFKRSIRQIPDDWKLLYLGASQYVWRVPEGLGYPDQTKTEVEEETPYYFPRATDGSFAMGLHSSIFDLLIRDILRMDCPFDSGPLRTVIEAFPKKCFVLNPNLVIADVSDSDIREDQDQYKLAEQLKWDTKLYAYPFIPDLVSVIMPAYNAEKTIEKAIRSILMQTYASLEIIVVDDASSDDTVGVVERMGSEDARVQLVKLEVNQGVGRARNAGVLKSKGAFIAFQDADDISLKDRLAYQLVPIYEKNVLFTVSRFYRSRCTSEELDVFDQEAMLQLVMNRRQKKKNGWYDYRDRAVIGLATTVYRRSVFEQFGLFGAHRFGEDLEFVERILFHKLHRHFDDNYNGHTYLTDHSSVARVMVRVDKTLCISPEMNEGNLTRQFQKNSDAKMSVTKEFRAKYTSGDLSQYEKLPSGQVDIYTPKLFYNTMIIDSMVSLPEVDYQMLLKSIAVNKKHKQADPSIQDIHDSWSWKITAPLRWLGGLVHKIRRSSSKP